MNWSMYTADRTTHLKIVVVGLCAALLQCAQRLRRTRRRRIAQRRSAADAAVRARD